LVATVERRVGKLEWVAQEGGLEAAVMKQTLSVALSVMQQMAVRALWKNSVSQAAKEEHVAE